MKRKNPKTSIDACKSIDPEKIRKMYKDILRSLSALGAGTYEDIAKDLNEKPDRIWRRLSEMGNMGLIHRPGDRRLMASGRYGMIWKLGSESEVESKKKRVMKGPTVQQFAKAIDQVKSSQNTINRLF